MDELVRNIYSRLDTFALIVASRCHARTPKWIFVIFDYCYVCQFLANSSDESLKFEERQIK